MFRANAIFFNTVTADAAIFVERLAAHRGLLRDQGLRPDLLDPDTGFSLNPEFVDEVIAAIRRSDITTVRTLVYPLPAPDQAELFDQLSHDERQWLADAISAEFDSDTLAELSPEAAEDVIEALGPEKSAEVLAELETDDAVHILEDLTRENQQELLDVMPAAMREEVSQSLTYPEDSAGRMMRRALVAVPEFWTVGDTIDFMRGAEELPEFFYVIYTVDTHFRPSGRVQRRCRDMSCLTPGVQLATLKFTDAYGSEPPHTNDDDDLQGTLPGL